MGLERYHHFDALHEPDPARSAGGDVLGSDALAHAHGGSIFAELQPRDADVLLGNPVWFPRLDGNESL